MRAAVLAAVLVLAGACSSTPAPTSAPIVWGANVPVSAPDAVAAQSVVARGPNTITLLPVSPTGAIVATDYAYAMPHCGIHSPIDVDGSFWDAVGVAPTSVDFDGVPGTFRLVSPKEATFTDASGRILHLVRHAGAKEFPFCM